MTLNVLLVCCTFVKIGVYIQAECWLFLPLSWVQGKGLLHGYSVVLCGEFKEMTRGVCVWLKNDICIRTPPPTHTHTLTHPPTPLTDQVTQLLQLSGAQLFTEGDMPSASSSSFCLSICDTPAEGDRGEGQPPCLQHELELVNDLISMIEHA